MRFLASIQASFKLIFKERRRLVPVLLLDLTFLVLFALVHTFIVLQALPDLSAINQLVAQESQNVPQMPDADIDPSHLQFSFPMESFQPRYAAVLEYTAIYLAIMFMLYNLLFAFAWLRTSTVCRRRPMPYWAYLKRFLIVNAIWALVFLLGSYAMILVSAATMFGEVALVSQWVVDAAGALLGVLLLYFVMISHTLVIDRKVFPLLKKTFVVGVKKIASAGPAFLLILLVYYAIFQLISLASLSSALLPFVLLMLLFLPWMTASRALFMLAAEPR